MSRSGTVEQASLMLRRIVRLCAVVFAVVPAACNSNANPYSLFGPSTGPSASPSPVPNITQSTVTATYKGQALANVTITLAQDAAPSSSPNSQKPGAVIGTQTTNSSGQATFTNLTPGTSYCWYYTYQPNGAGTSPNIYVVDCTNFWYNGVKLSG
jgi:hypothetical protein